MEWFNRIFDVHMNSLANKNSSVSVFVLVLERVWMNSPLGFCFWKDLEESWGLPVFYRKNLRESWDLGCCCFWKNLEESRKFLVLFKKRFEHLVFLFLKELEIKSLLSGVFSWKNLESPLCFIENIWRNLWILSGTSNFFVFERIWRNIHVHCVLIQITWKHFWST